MENAKALGQGTPYVLQEIIYDRGLFNLGSANKACNSINFENGLNTYVSVNDKTLFARSVLKELGLSNNLIVNANLVLEK